MPSKACPDCAVSSPDRREFVASSLTWAAAAALPVWATPKASTLAQSSPKSVSETAVKAFFDSLTPDQKKVVCFPWDHHDEKRGLLRTHVSNNWQITRPAIDSPFYSPAQRAMLYDVFKGLFQPEWVKKLEKQLRDDNGGRPWGAAQSVAVFGTPGSDKFSLVMTGRHLTIRADGNSEAHVALGGPIFHGHAAEGFVEKPHHPGNIFWHQALEANKVFTMLDGKQRRTALVAQRPPESEVPFRGDAPLPGLPVREMTPDQKQQVVKTLESLVEPYREEDRKEILACLEKNGGLDRCSLAFYQDGDLGDDGVWDNWRLEGPSFVWYFRGEPHVHIWIHVADVPTVPLNATG